MCSQTAHRQVQALQLPALPQAQLHLLHLAQELRLYYLKMVISDMVALGAQRELELVVSLGGILYLSR